VGAGSGLLQDHVADYTGLDISPTAGRFFHKPFVEASATEMPFPDASFDALWTVWVLEHIPNPELALIEMRRVTKPGGYMLLYPALDVSRFTADGLHVRPYKDLDWSGKLRKALIPFAESKFFHFLYFHQVRALRSLGTRLGGGPSRFHFIRLEPNYDHYWEGDSDATGSFSNHELYLWFKTRGDTCLNCPSEARLTFRDHPTSFLIVQKNTSGN
jgi:SAM-dependent methyltransferase